jgi:hypothetical protein
MKSMHTSTFSKSQQITTDPQEESKPPAANNAERPLPTDPRTMSPQLTSSTSPQDHTPE